MNHPISHTRWALLGVLFLALTLLAPAAGVADDRDLVREGGRVPYLMVIFDVSGSMNWQPGGDLFAPGYGDDPNSKFYQAKSALFRVVSDPELDDIFWGFSTYNQDNVGVYRKHWLYSPSVALPWVANDTLPYPKPGDPKHFGDNCMDDSDLNTTCDLDGNDRLGTCASARDVDDAESWGEILTFPVTGDVGATTTEEWVRHNGRRFFVTFELDSGNLGDETIGVRVTLREVRNDCQVWLSATEARTIPFERTYASDLQGRNLPGGNEVLFWQIDSSTDAHGNPNGFYSPDDTRATNTCAGWEPNDDGGSDDWGGVNLKYHTTPDPDARHTSVMDRGDVIPLDWASREVWGVPNKDLILQRLAPNYDPADPTIVPDFRAAPYFRDHPNQILNGRLELLPQYVNTPPLLPNGATPIGNSMRDFMNHFDTWKTVATGPDGDEFFGCRSINLLIITDGDETCYNGSQTGQTDRGGDANPCWIAERLRTEKNRDIRTFVIGFGLQGQATNFLDCIAEKGGTSAIDTDGDGTTDITGPILPGNEDELVDALRSVIETIRAQERSFAAAAVPQGQATVQDKAYLTSFLPLEDESIWPGRLDAYLRPIPVKDAVIELADGTSVTRKVPDPDKACTSGDKSSCHLWNAGEELLDQAATATKLLAGDYNLGPGEAERRVYFGRDSGAQVPYDRADFERPTSNPEWRDLLAAMAICDPADAACALDSDNRAEAIETLDFFHQVKSGVDPRDGKTIEYLLGDIFHSDPTVIGNPDSFRYWVADVAGSGTLPLQNVCSESPDGYRCFFAKHQYRRKMLLAGSNDGQLHAFDAGIFRGKCKTSPLTGQEFVTGAFDNGSGRELFSFVPRSAMPDLVQLKENLDHQFTVDGRVAFGDVFIDPLHKGTPTEDEREWRSVVMAGLREGGSAYFALDVTQPDDLSECGGIPVLPKARSGALGYVPSCDGGSCGGAQPFPALLWEFTDTEDCGLNKTGDYLQLANGQCDSDENGLADLADAWSRPAITRIRVLADVGGSLERVDKFVAIFGGGSDPARKGSEQAEGNHIFMVDVETGKAIYKRKVPDGRSTRPSGAVAADVAAVDLDQDGYTDTVYFGTTGGFMYKMDISLPQELESVTGAGLKITSSVWDPFPVFDTGGRPIYFEPAVVFVAKLGRYALSFGTGDREDLWSMDDEEGRIYMILDTGFTAADVDSGQLPRTESDYQRIDFTSATTQTDYLQQPPHGWYLRLDKNERVITRAFSLAGITVLSSFQPREDTSDGGVCRRFGNSRVTVVTTTSANSLLSSGERFFMIPAGFVSTPFAELGQTKNPDGGGSTSDELPSNLENVLAEIRKLFPSNCRFANYTLNIKAVRDDTGIEFLAAVPVCTFETNWRSF